MTKTPAIPPPVPAARPGTHVTTMTCKPDAAMREFCGSQVEGFNYRLINDVMAALWFSDGESEELKTERRVAVAASLAAFKPTDEIEGMIAAQAVAMHLGVMVCAQRAMIREQPHDIVQACRKSAAQMSGAFTELLSALDRKRGKSGHQKVTVEHVHVYAGGQAIVGTVAPNTQGGGAKSEAQGKPREFASRIGARRCRWRRLPPAVARGPGAGLRVAPQRCQTAGAEYTAALARGRAPRRESRASARRGRSTGATGEKCENWPRWSGH